MKAVPGGALATVWGEGRGERGRLTVVFRWVRLGVVFWVLVGF